MENNPILSDKAPTARLLQTIGPGHFIARLWQSWAGLLLLSLIFTFVILYTYITPFKATLHHRDYILQAWNLWLVNESLIHGRSPYFTELQYYPLGAHLGRHVLSPGFFPVTFLVWLLSGGNELYPLYAYKVIILLSYTLILYFSYLTLRETGLSKGAALIPSVAYAFGDFYMFHIHRLHIISGFFIPLAAFALIKLFKNPTRSKLALCAFIFAVGFYFTELTLYIYMATALFVVLLFALPLERQQLLATIRLLGVNSFLVSVVIFLGVMAYFAFQWLSSDALAPDPNEAFRYSANLLGFLTPTQLTTPLYGALFTNLDDRLTVGIRGFEIFMGFPLFILGVIAIFMVKKRLVRVTLWLSLIFLVLSLGPTLKILNFDTEIGLPYTLLASLPPFNVGRTPVRFVAMAFFLWMIVAGHGSQWLQEYLKIEYGPRFSVAVIALFFAWTTAEVYSPIQRQQPYVMPPQFGQLAAGPVINLPLKYHDPWALLPQIFYNQPTATGYVSRNSEEQAAYFKTLQVYYAEALETGSCQRFEALGFANIVVWPGVPDDVVFGLYHSPNCSLKIIDIREFYE